jgi:methylmalonyl-CoA mutase, C-terminal domain
MAGDLRATMTPRLTRRGNHGARSTSRGAGLSSLLRVPARPKHDDADEDDPRGGGEARPRRARPPAPRSSPARDAGMEVIYTGLHQTPEQIVETVIQEDADAVGLSILSGAHMTLVPRIVELLREQGVDDVLLTVGGTIPADDIPQLKELGVAEVFTPGASTQDIIDFIQDAVRRRGAR